MSGEPAARDRGVLRQLSAVVDARRARLDQERRALAERERQLAAAFAALAADETMLAAQREQWRLRWQGWVGSQAALSQARALQSDRRMLGEIDGMLRARRQRCEQDAAALRSALDDWCRRWRGVDALDAQCDERRALVERAIDRAAERRADEDAVLAGHGPHTRQARLA